MAAIDTRSDLVIIPADHPSLDRDVDRFVDGLRAEARYFGPSAGANPKPFASLRAALRQRDGFRLAAVECGRVIGLVRVDEAGELWIAVTPEYRGKGLGTRLCAAAVERASMLGYRRLLIRTSHRSRAARRVGEALGCSVIERGRGRIDLIIDLAVDEHTA